MSQSSKYRLGSCALPNAHCDKAPPATNSLPRQVREEFECLLKPARQPLNVELIDLFKAVHVSKTDKSTNIAVQKVLVQ